jgi:uncharacterized protein (TIGR03118 family)
LARSAPGLKRPGAESFQDGAGRPKNAVVAYDGSTNGSVYEGVAIDPSSKLLFAADFVNNQVQVFDNQFNVAGSFTDSSLTGYAPFNVAVIDGDLYVAFARQKRIGCDERHGAGFGYIDIFSESGTMLQQLVARGPLNAPGGHGDRAFEFRLDRRRVARG